MPTNMPYKSAIGQPKMSRMKTKRLANRRKGNEHSEQNCMTEFMQQLKQSSQGQGSSLVCWVGRVPTSKVLQTSLSMTHSSWGNAAIFINMNETPQITSPRHM